MLDENDYRHLSIKDLEYLRNALGKIIAEKRDVHNYKVGDTAYILLNPEVVPKGYAKLTIIEDDGHLVAIEADHPQRYRVDKWHHKFFQPELRWCEYCNKYTMQANGQSNVCLICLKEK